MLFLAIIGLVIFTQVRNRPQTLQTAEVKKQDIKSVVSASGTLIGANTVNLHFKTSGRLFFLSVKAGDSVERGQIIANLDAAGEISGLNEAQNTLRDKEAALRKIYDDIHLFQYGNGGFANVGTGNETETQRAARIAAEVSKDNAFEGVRQAQKALADTSLISPVSGIVLKADFVEGQNVTASDTIVQIANTEKVIMEAEVDEADFAKILVGQSAQVTLDAYPDMIFEGVVSEIVPITRVTGSGSTVVLVKIVLDEPNMQFVSGLNGQVSIILEKQKDVLTIPIEALGEDNTVFIQTDRGRRPKKVVIGIKSDTEVEIKEGLSENEKVLLNQR